MALDKRALLLDIEKKGDVQAVTVNGVPLWPYFRVHFIDRLAGAAGSEVQIGSANLLAYLNGLWYRRGGRIKDHSNWVFSKSDERKLLDGMWVDKSADGLHEGLDDVIDFELPVPAHRPLAQVPTRAIRSRIPMKLQEKWQERIASPRVKGIEVLHDLCREHRSAADPMALARRLATQVSVVEGLLRKARPKRVFMVAPYLNPGYVLAFQREGIPVIELQHGVIAVSHEGYNLGYVPDAPMIPHHLFCYGESVRDLFTGGGLCIYLPGNVHVVGHYYLDAITSRSRSDERFARLVAGSDRVVAVSLQEDHFGDQLVPLVNEAARLDPTIAYVLVPRFRDPGWYRSQITEPNVFFAPWLNVYEVIMLSHVHVTLFSTTAIEAVALGVPNVLVDLDGRATQYYGTTLTTARFTHYATSAHELAGKIRSLGSPDRSAVRMANSALVKPGYQENLREALKKVT